MKLITHYMGAYSGRIALSIFIKFLGSVTELAIPYILAHLIDEVVPLRSGALVALWGALMILTAVATRQFNVCANRIAVDNAHRVSYDVRRRCSQRRRTSPARSSTRSACPALSAA